MYKAILDLIPENIALSIATAFIMFFLFRHHHNEVRNETELQLKRFAYLRDENKEFCNTLKDKNAQIKTNERQIRKLEKIIAEQKRLIQVIFNEKQELEKQLTIQLSPEPLRNDLSNFHFSKDFLES